MISRRRIRVAPCTDRRKRNGVPLNGNLARWNLPRVEISAHPRRGERIVGSGRRPFGPAARHQDQDRRQVFGHIDDHLPPRRAGQVGVVGRGTAIVPLPGPVACSEDFLYVQGKTVAAFPLRVATDEPPQQGAVKRPALRRGISIAKSARPKRQRRTASDRGGCGLRATPSGAASIQRFVAV